ncbi:zinc finger protein OZF-like isoform X2 [Ixodes scapularis]
MLLASMLLAGCALLEWGHPLGGQVPLFLVFPLSLPAAAAILPPRSAAGAHVGSLNWLVLLQMPGCCVPQCSNHSRNGWKLYRVPTNAERSRLWLVQIKRDDWEPSRSSSVCGVSSTNFVSLKSPGLLPHS